MFNFFKKGIQADKKEYFLGLVIKEDEGEVIIFEVGRATKTVQIIDQKKFLYTNSWENLVDDIDASLFELEQKSNIHVEKVVFFLYSHLVDQTTHHIQKPYLSKIKAIVEELELSLEGYAEFHESIALHLAYVEQAPLTAVIAEVDKPAVSLFIYKGGRLIVSQTASKTENIASDFEEILNKLKGDYIPTRIILYDSTSLQEESTKLITHSWKEGLFMQIPKFEIYTKDKLNGALIQSFSQKLFGEMVTDFSSESSEVEGFLIGEDIRKSQPQESGSPDDLIEKVYLPCQNPFKKAFLSVQLFIQSMTGKIFASNSYPKIALFLSIIGLILIFSSLGSILFLLHKATVTIYFQGSKIEKELTIDGSKLSIEKSKETVEASDSTTTTGKKTIGDKAKGSVVIFNMKTQERTLKKGSALQTDSGIAFVLDSDIKIASASSSVTGEGNVTIITGKQKVGVTASEIGTKGNIAKDTKLKIDGVSSEDSRAQVDSTFTGGSEKEVQTVSKDDMIKLQAAVEKKIRQQGDEIVKKTAAEKRTITDLTKIATIQKKYSKELSEEADSLSLSIQSDVEFYSYKDPDLKKIISDTLQGTIDDRYELSPSNINYSLLEAQEKSGDISMKIKIEAKPLRKVDKEKITADIKGKTIERLEKIVKEKYGAVGYEASIQAPISLLQSWMPFFTKNIEVRVKSL